MNVGSMSEEGKDEEDIVNERHTYNISSHIASSSVRYSVFNVRNFKISIN